MNQIALPLEIFLSQSVLWIGKLILAYIIWLIGKYFINLTIRLIDKADIKSWRVDDTVRNTLKIFIAPVAKIILVLVILDTLGIGSNVVSAIMSGLTFTVSIALGMSFAKALEPFANEVVTKISNNYRK